MHALATADSALSLVRSIWLSSTREGTFMASLLIRGTHEQLKRMAGVSPATQTSTPKQGQYLAYIHLHRRPAAETDIQEYFRVSPRRFTRC